MAPSTPPSTKTASSSRVRLSLACNQCRKRKVRCDTEVPKCRNCWLRDEVCETTDPRYPGTGPTVRRWATRNGLLPGQHPEATHRNQAQMPKHGPTGIGNAGSEDGRSDGAHDTMAIEVALAPPPDSGRNSACSELAQATVTTTISSTSPNTGNIFSAPSRDNLNSNTTPQRTTEAASDDRVQRSWVSQGYETSSLHARARFQGLSQHEQDQDQDHNHSHNQDQNQDYGRNHGQDHHRADLVVNTEDNSHRVKYMGGSSIQCLAAFVNIYLGRKGLPIVSTHFRAGMRSAEEFPLPLHVSMPSLPDDPIPQLATFFGRIWPLYPVVERAGVEADIQRFLIPNQLDSLTSADVPSLVIVFCIIALGLDEAAGEPTEAGGVYVRAAYSLFAHLVATPYLASVQALFLLALTLRCRCIDGQAWHVLAQAVRVAHSIGLHRRILQRTQTVQQQQLQVRVWWSCYALERLMELETGRPSAVGDDDEGIDQTVPSLWKSPSLSSSEDFLETLDIFSLWVDLARIIGQISDRLYHHNPRSAAELMREIGKLDQQLLDWAKAMPDSLKPGHELFAGMGQQPHQQHLASFLSLQYYQAQITILRISLVFPTQSFIDEVQRIGPANISRTMNSSSDNNSSSSPQYLRLLQSENLCVASARTMARHVLELADHGPLYQSLLFSPTQLFLATMVLALHIVKHPGKRLVRTDLELLITSTEHLEVLFRRGQQQPAFIGGFETLRTSVVAAVQMEQPQTQQRKRTASLISRLTPASDNGPELHHAVGSGGGGETGVRNEGDNDWSHDVLNEPWFTNDGSSLFPGQPTDSMASLLGEEMPLEELWGAIGTYSFLQPSDEMIL